MKNNLREQKAITLVALIITIIVLLILAMVSISLVVNSGIITKSKTAVDRYPDEEIQEMIKTGYSEYKMAQFTGQALSLDDALTHSGLTEKNITGEGPWTITVGEKSYILQGDGSVTQNSSSSGGSSSGGSGVAISSLDSRNYGDYINLGTSILSGKPADWRILYNDTNNTYGGTDGARVYAILADYLPNTNAAVAAAGFKTDTVNDISGAYNVYSSTSRQNLLDRLENEEAWKTLISTALQNKGAKVRGATTGEILMASYNEKYGTSLNYTSFPYLRTNPNDSSSSIDTLYMPHPGSRDYNGCWGYWLASPYAGTPSGVWNVYYGGYVDYDRYTSTAYGVCPVVSLPSDIQVTKNGNVWTVLRACQV